MFLASSWLVTAFEVVGAPISVPGEHFTDENKVLSEEWTARQSRGERACGSEPEAS